jgi:hypothetical protein
MENIESNVKLSPHEKIRYNGPPPFLSEIPAQIQENSSSQPSSSLFLNQKKPAHLFEI